MRVLLNGQNTKNIEKLAKDLGLEIVYSNPQIVVTFGGDGTLLSAERHYPNIPKLPIRNSDFCKKCLNHADELVLKKLREDKLQLKEYRKLEITLLYKTFYALNDFVIRNSDPTHTIRFKTHPVSHVERNEGSLLIGDGIVISTPFGSTGYFQSITRQTFDKGFGVAFNNTTQKIDPLYLSDQDLITFQLTRGKATLSFDNSPDIFTIDEDSQLVFKLSNQTAKIYADTSLRCPNCQIIRS
ncbi:NAD(+)/NADH kinase [Candidatus Daviesbacteria bacterium]|nr:NAD(+)/NADH kinase [Candidatus Daviesbacteria bacterium]